MANKAEFQSLQPNNLNRLHYIQAIIHHFLNHQRDIIEYTTTEGAYPCTENTAHYRRQRITPKTRATVFSIKMLVLDRPNCHRLLEIAYTSIP